MNNETERTWKEAVVACCKALSRLFFAWTYETTENLSPDCWSPDRAMDVRGNHFAMYIMCMSAGFSMCSYVCQCLFNVELFDHF
jgi:hypothetical protein